MSKHQNHNLGNRKKQYLYNVAYIYHISKLVLILTLKDVDELVFVYFHRKLH